MNGYSVETFHLRVRVFYNLHIVEADINPLVCTKVFFQVVDIFLLALFLVSHFIISNSCAISFLDFGHRTCDNQCIFAEDIIQKLNILFVVSCTELLYVGKNFLATGNLGDCFTFLHHILINSSA